MCAHDTEKYVPIPQPGQELHGFLLQTVSNSNPNNAKPDGPTKSNNKTEQKQRNMILRKYLVFTSSLLCRTTMAHLSVNKAKKVAFS